MAPERGAIGVVPIALGIVVVIAVAVAAVAILVATNQVSPSETKLPPSSTSTGQAESTHATTFPNASSIPQCTNIAISTTITPIPCGFAPTFGESPPYEFVVNSINLTAPSPSGKNGTFTLTLTLKGSDQENTTLWSMYIWLNRSLLIGPSPAIMWNGTRIIEVPSTTAHVIAGQRYEVILDEVYTPGGPPPAGEPITNELRVFLRAV